MIVLVNSCDRYADCWPGLLQLLSRYWPDRPWPLRVVTNGAQVPKIGGATALDVGPDQGWCPNLVRALQLFDAGEVLLLQEDFWPTSFWCQKEIDNGMSLLEGAACVRLYPCPGADGEPLGGAFASWGRVTHGAPYIASAQAALWQIGALAALCAGLTTCADFELFGTERLRQWGWTVLAWRRECEPWPVQYLCSAVTRGRWNPDARALAGREGLAGCDFSRRAIDID